MSRVLDQATLGLFGDQSRMACEWSGNSSEAIISYDDEFDHGSLIDGAMSIALAGG